jgi:hypothetical protein
MYFVHVRICEKQSAPAMAMSFVENDALHGTSVVGAHDLAGWLASSIPTPHVCLAARSKFQVLVQISVAKFAKRRKKHIFFPLPSS